MKKARYTVVMATAYQTQAMKIILRLIEIVFCSTDSPLSTAHTLYMQYIIDL